MVQGETERFADLIAQSGQPGAVADEFAAMYRAWQGGGGCVLDWDALKPVSGAALPVLGEIPPAPAGSGTLEGLAWVVLNGGLGTTMRMTRAKSLVEVRGRRTFLDLLVEGARQTRERHGSTLPLIFMNSFATDRDTREALDGLGFAPRTADRTFVQNRFPRIRIPEKTPIGGPDDPEAWAPPGHGDLYLALSASGLLRRLLDTGTTHLFISNADNLGASPDPAIFAYMKELPRTFLLELTRRTLADVKGGALVTIGGVPTLLEAAMVPEEMMARFTDIAEFPSFNTNNVWLDLRALEKLLEKGRIELPVIANRKSVGGVEVIQLEHALGAAVANFPDAGGILVPRSRFAPVKTVEDLLVRRSDCYVEGGDAPLTISPDRPPELGVVKVSLDSCFYASVDDLDLRVPHPLGLVLASSLTVKGDVRFGRGVKIVGDAFLENRGPEPLLIPDGALLGGKVLVG